MCKDKCVKCEQEKCRCVHNIKWPQSKPSGEWKRPDKEFHFYFSLLKSAARIVGCFCFMLYPLQYNPDIKLIGLAGLSFLIAEAFGIIEELV